MSLTKKLLEIDSIINGEGGLNFIFIRAVLEDVEKEIEKGNPQAIRFAQDIDNVLRFCQLASKPPTKTRG